MFAVAILNLVVDTGIEPVTYTMSTWCSTPELIDCNWSPYKDSNLDHTAPNRVRNLITL